MGVAKVILNSQTLMDVTQKTVTSSNLLSGFTALGADGEAVVGSYVPADNVFVVEVAYNISTQLWEPNKTITEIRTAYAAGKHITVEVDLEQYNRPVTTDGWYNDDTGDFLYYVAFQDASTCYYNCYALSNNGVTVMDAETFIIPAGTLSILSNGSYDVGSYASASVNVQPSFQSKTVTPSTSQIVVTPDEGYDRVLNNITDSVTATGTTTGVSYSTSYNKKPMYFRLNGSITITGTVFGAQSITFTFTNVIRERTSSSTTTASWSNIWAWDGQTYQGVSVNNTSLANDSIKRITIGYNSGTISLAYVTEDASTGWTIALSNVSLDFSDDVNFGEGFDGLSQVTVEPIPSSYIIPAGTLSISANGTYGVTSYASVDVSVAGGGGITTEDIVFRSISGSVYTSSTFIMSYLFYSCSNITAAEGSNVTGIAQYAFYKCTNLERASFPSCVSIASTAFSYCTSLKTAYFPLCNTVSSCAFYMCFSLSEVNFQSCTSIQGSAFGSCSSLNYINLPKCKFIGAAAFIDCQLLSDISAPLCSSIMANAFTRCSSLQKAIFSSCKMVGSAAFTNCVALSIADFPLVSSIYSGAFAGDSSLKTISFPECQSIGSSAFDGCSALQSVYFPSCTSVYQEAFRRCINLETASFPVLKSGAYSVFYGCSNLKSVYLPQIGSILTNFFRDCYSLSEIILPATSYLWSIAFYNCWTLLSVYLLSSNVVALQSFSNQPATSPFVSTPIVGFTDYTSGVYGSVFVPESLYNSYITFSHWSDISDRIVSMTSAEIAALLSTYGT